MKYVRIFAYHFEHVLQHRARNFVWFLIAFLNPFILLLFWQGALRQGNLVGDWTVANVRTYYLLVMIAQSLLLSHVELIVQDEIKHGDLVRDLLRPVSYLWMKFCDETPWRLVQGMYGLFAVILLAFLNIRIEIHDDLLLLGGASIVALLGYFLSYLFKMILGIISFWTTDIYSLLETNDVLLLMFTGILMPINLFPSWMQTIAQFTPYPYVVYYPVSSFIGKYNFAELLGIMLNQSLWIIALFIIYQLLWRRGIKQFTAVGQ